MNRFTSLLSLKYPIIQGPFGGGLSNINLVKIVADFGGLGSFGAHHLPAEKIATLVQDIKAVTKGAFAINLWVSDHDHFTNSVTRSHYQEYVDLFTPTYQRLDISPPEYTESFSESFEQQLQATIDAGPPAISFVYGVPSKTAIDLCKQKKIRTIGTATTLQEALALEGAGIDIIVASGFEAGGHRVSFKKEAEDSLIGGLSLIPQIADKVNTPVIAAGGIADSRGVRAVMQLGAQGAQIGTAFLACQESGTTEMHREMLFSSLAHHTVLSRAYTGRLARFIENDFIRYVEKTKGLPLAFPMQNHFTASIKDKANSDKNPDFASLYAGQSAPLIQYSKTTDLLNSLVADFN